TRTPLPEALAVLSPASRRQEAAFTALVPAPCLVVVHADIDEPQAGPGRTVQLGLPLLPVLLLLPDDEVFGLRQGDDLLYIQQSSSGIDVRNQSDATDIERTLVQPEHRRGEFPGEV